MKFSASDGFRTDFKLITGSAMVMFFTEKKSDDCESMEVRVAGICRFGMFGEASAALEKADIPTDVTFLKSNSLSEVPAKE